MWVSRQPEDPIIMEARWGSFNTQGNVKKKKARKWGVIKILEQN